MGKIILTAQHGLAGRNYSTHEQAFQALTSLQEGEIVIWETDKNDTPQRKNRLSNNPLALNVESAIYDCVTSWESVMSESGGATSNISNITKANFTKNATNTADAINHVLKGRSVLNKQRNAIRVELFDPYKKSLDYTIWKQTANNIFLTYMTFHTLKGIKDVENQVQRTRSEIQERNRTRMSGWTDKTSANWETQNEIFSQEMAQYNLDRDAWWNNKNTEITNEYSAQFRTQWGLYNNKRSVAIGRTTAINKGDLNVFQNLFDNLVREIDKTKALQKYKNKKNIVFVGKKGALTDMRNDPRWTGMNLKNLHHSNWSLANKEDYDGQVPTLQPPPKPDLENAPEMPNFAMAKMALGAYLGYKLCMFGSSTLTSLFSRAKENARGTDRAVNFETSSIKLMQTSRVFGQRSGQTMLMTAAKTKMQSHNLDAFIGRTIEGVGDVYNRVKDHFDGDVLEQLPQNKKYRIYDFDPSGKDSADAGNGIMIGRFYTAPKCKYLIVKDGGNTNMVRAEDVGVDLRVEMEPTTDLIAGTSLNYLKVRDVKIANGGEFDVTITNFDPDLYDGIKAVFFEDDATIRRHFAAEIQAGTFSMPNVIHGYSGTVRVSNDRRDIKKQYSWMLAGHMFENLLDMWRLYRNKSYVVKSKWGRPANRKVTGLAGQWLWWRAPFDHQTMPGSNIFVDRLQADIARFSQTNAYPRFQVMFPPELAHIVSALPTELNSPTSVSPTTREYFLEGTTQDGQVNYSTRIKAELHKTQILATGQVQAIFKAIQTRSGPYLGQGIGGQSLGVNVGSGKGSGTQWRVYSSFGYAGFGTIPAAVHDDVAQYKVGDVTTFKDASGWNIYYCIKDHHTFEEVLKQYPTLTREKIRSGVLGSTIGDPLQSTVDFLRKATVQRGNIYPNTERWWTHIITPENNQKYWQRLGGVPGGSDPAQGILNAGGMLHANPQYIPSSKEWKYQRFLEFKTNELAHFTKICAQILVGDYKLARVAKRDRKPFGKRNLEEQNRDFISSPTANDKIDWSDPINYWKWGEFKPRDWKASGWIATSAVRSPAFSPNKKSYANAYLEPVIDSDGRLHDVKVIFGGYGYKSNSSVKYFFGGGGDIEGHQMRDIKLEFELDSNGSIIDVRGGYANSKSVAPPHADILGRADIQYSTKVKPANDNNRKTRFWEQPYIVVDTPAPSDDTNIVDPQNNPLQAALFDLSRLSLHNARGPVALPKANTNTPDWGHHQEASTITKQEAENAQSWVYKHPARFIEDWDSLYKTMLNFMLRWMDEVNDYKYGIRLWDNSKNQWKNWDVSGFSKARQNTNEAIRNASTTNPANGNTNAEEVIPSELKDACRTFFSYTPHFGWCQDQKFNNISEQMATSTFASAAAFQVWHAPHRLAEAMCNKKGCGAVHAYTTVPPIGQVDSNVTKVPHDVVNNANHDLCGDVEITWQLFPTANFYLAGLLGKQDGLVDSFLKWSWFENEIQVSKNIIPKYAMASANSFYELSAAEDWSWKAPLFLGLLFKKKKSSISSGNAMLPEVWGNWSDSFGHGVDQGAVKKALRFAFGGTMRNVANLVTSLFGVSIDAITGAPDFSIVAFQKLAKTPSKFSARTQNSYKINGGAEQNTINMSGLVPGTNIRIKTEANSTLLQEGESLNIGDTITFAPDVAKEEQLFNKDDQFKFFAAKVTGIPAGAQTLPPASGTQSPLARGGTNQGPTTQNNLRLHKTEVTIDLRVVEGLLGATNYQGGDADQNASQFENYLGKVQTGGAKSPAKEVMDDITRLKIKYWQERLKRIGWGPYAHEYLMAPKNSTSKAYHKSRGTDGQALEASTDIGKSVDADRVKPDGIALYHQRHLMKILQGFVNDLKGEDNIHPSRYHNTKSVNLYTDNDRKDLPSIMHDMSAGSAITQTPYNSISVSDLHNPAKNTRWDNPLIKKRYLSGVCYPRVIQSGIKWSPFMYAVSGELDNDWQPWGQNNPDESSANLNWAPPSISNYLNSLGDNYKFDQGIYNATTTTWDKLDQHHRHAFKKFRQEFSTYDIGLLGNQETSKMFDGAPNAKSINIPEAMKNYAYSVQEFLSTNDKHHYEVNAGTYAVQEPRVGSQNVQNVHANSVLENNAFGRDNSTSQRPASFNNQDNLYNDNKKIPQYTINPRYSFRGKGDWEGLSKQLDDKLGELCQYHPAIYIDDISFAMIHHGWKEDGSQSFEGVNVAAGPGDTTYKGVGADGKLTIDPINLNDFAKHYVDGHIMVNDKVKDFNTQRPKWTQAKLGDGVTNKYASAWEYAYAHGLTADPGSFWTNGVSYPPLKSWFLRGTSCTSVEDALRGDGSVDDLKSVSGQYREYSRLINKFHYTGVSRNWIRTGAKQLTSTVSLPNGRGASDPYFTGVGFGLTTEEAEKNAYAAMEQMARHKITGAKAPYHFWSDEETFVCNHNLFFTNINGQSQEWQADYCGRQGFEAACMTGLICYESGYHRSIQDIVPNGGQVVGNPAANVSEVTLDLNHVVSCPNSTDTWIGYLGACTWNVLDAASKQWLKYAQAGEEKPLQGCITPRFDWTANTTNVFKLSNHNEGVGTLHTSTSAAKCDLVNELRSQLVTVSGASLYNNDPSYCWARFSGIDSVDWLPPGVCSNNGEGYFDWRRMSTGDAAGTTNTTNPWFEEKLSFSDWKRDKVGTAPHFSPCSYNTSAEETLLGLSNLSTNEDPCRIVCGTSTASEAAASGIVQQQIEAFRSSDVYQYITEQDSNGNYIHSGAAGYENIKCWIGNQNDTPVTCEQVQGGGRAWGFDSYFIPTDVPTGDGYNGAVEGTALACFNNISNSENCPWDYGNFTYTNITDITFETAGSPESASALDVLNAIVEFARVNSYWKMMSSLRSMEVSGPDDQGEYQYVSDWLNTGNYISDGTAWEIMFNPATQYAQYDGTPNRQRGPNVPEGPTLINTLPPAPNNLYTVDTNDWKRNPADTSCNLHVPAQCTGAHVGRWFTNWAPTKANCPNLNQDSSSNWDALDGTTSNSVSYDELGSVSNNSTMPSSLSFYEQCFTGKNSDDSYYFYGLGHWLVAHDPNDPINDHWKCCMQVDCDNHKINLSGIKPTIESDGYRRAVVTGRYSGIKKEYVVDTELLRNRYTGIMYASGVIPMVTGMGGWTNMGAQTLQTNVEVVQGGVKKNVDIKVATDQAYTYHLGDDKLVDVELQRTSVANRPIGQTVAASVNRQNEESSRLNQFTETGNIGRIAGFSAKEMADEHHLVNFNVTALDANNNETPVHGKGLGDLVFMGGWPLANPAWPNDLPVRKSYDQEVGSKDYSSALGERKCVILVSAKDLQSMQINLSSTEEKKKLTQSNKKRFTVTCRHSESLHQIRQIKPRGGVYTSPANPNTHEIVDVFTNQLELNNFVTAATNSVNIINQAYHSASSTNNPQLGIKVKTDSGEKIVEGVIFEWQAALSTCEECVAHPLDKDQPEKQAAGDFRPKYNSPALMFGEQFMVGMRHKWNMRSGNWSFEVPFSEGVSRINISNDPNNPDFRTIDRWENMVWPSEEDQDKYDARLARTGYVVAPNTKNTPAPPAIGCGAKSKLDGVIDFKIASNRAWTEIPMGGLVEVANYHTAGTDLPFFVGQPDVGAAIGQDGLYSVTGKYAYDHPAYIDLRHQNWTEKNGNTLTAEESLREYYEHIKKLGYTTEGLQPNSHVVVGQGPDVQRQPELNLTEGALANLFFMKDKKANILDEGKRAGTDGNSTHETL